MNGHRAATRRPSDVEPQIHLFEGAMKRDRNAKQASIREEKTNEADERISVVGVQLSARRHEGFEKC